MIMIDRSRRLSEPLVWGRREKTAVAVLLAVAALAAVTLGAFALSSGRPMRRDCIEVRFASTTGGAQLHLCGARARSTCASPPESFEGLASSLRAACRRAGFPFAARD